MRLGDSDTYIDIDADEPVAANMPAAGDVRLPKPTNRTSGN